MTTLLYTGMRPGEALALHWDAIDWDHGLILVRATESRRYGRGLPKTKGSERDVEMIAPVRAALKDQRARSQMRGELVFPSIARTAIDLANFARATGRAFSTRAKVRPRTIYQCRHTFARLAIEYGDTPQHVAAQLGHTTVEMVFRVYSNGWRSPRADSKRSKKPSPIHHPKLAGNWRETMGTEGKKTNGLGTGATPQTSDGSEVSAKIDSASSQAGRRRFDPGRPLHCLLLS